MRQILRAIFGRVVRQPLKGTAILLAFALNAAVLSSVFAVYLTFHEYLATRILGPGTSLWLSFAPSEDPGRAYELADLPYKLLPKLKTKAGLRFVSPVSLTFWSSIVVGADTYSLGAGALGVDPDYAALSGLRLMAGSFISEQEALEGKGVAVVSENVARSIWGSPGAAIGGVFDPATGGSGPDIIQYRVVGVFSEPPEAQRRFFYIPGIFVPFQTTGWGGVPTVKLIRAGSDNPLSFAVSRRIRSALRAIYVEEEVVADPSVIPIWQGSVRDQWDNTDRALLSRLHVVSAFLAVMWIFCLLIFAGGILSLLSFDASSRLKEIGLRRAIGSTRARVLAQIAGEAAVIVFLANLLATGLTFLFIRSLLDAVKPLLACGGPLEEVLVAAGPVWKGLVVSLVASVATAALGSLPSGLSMARVTPSDALRDL